MPLNYSKWDQLELSDDSDIEGHPNVDKRSLIRWKQRDIHEKREIRRHRIEQLHAQIACNNVLLPRIKEISAKLANPTDSTPPTVYFNNLIEKTRANPSSDCPPGNDSSKLEQTYDGMLLSLLQGVAESTNKKIKEAGVTAADREEKLSKALVDEMAMHVKQLGETIEKDKKDVANEEAEQKKHITSEDIHDGFDSKYVPPKPEPLPIPNAKVDKPTKKVTEFEVLNPNATSSSATPPSPADEDEDEEALPELTPALEGFSQIPVAAYLKSYEFIQSHRDVYVPGAADALLVAAFQAQGKGQTKYARQCVHQSLLLQYCEKLGRDGVGIFFKRMISGGKAAEKVFVDDFENTYTHLASRVKATQEEQAAGREQIQLVPENPNVSISFNVPDGPPPEELVLEGPGTEGMDIEEVRKALQFRWDIFNSFPEDLQNALKEGGLDGVNQVLGDMEVPAAEDVVQKLDMAGILSFAEGGIRDATGQSDEVE